MHSMSLRRINLLLIPLLLVSLSACGEETSSTSEVEESAPAAVQQADTLQSQPDTAATAEKLNLNTASEEDFRTIPGVGDRMVGEFVEYRPYTSIRQFRREIGKYVDEDQVASYEQYVYVPVDPNESDAATLQQLPGLAADEASQLVNNRPFDSNEAFLNALGEYVSQEDLTAAENYLASS